jgi:hypothetical protein
MSEMEMKMQVDENTEVTVAPLCVACGYRRAHIDMVPGLYLCGDCIELGWAFLLVQDAMEHLNGGPLWGAKAATELRRYDVVQGRGAVPYVDSTASAWDWASGNEDVGELVGNLTKAISTYIASRSGG